MTIPTAGQINDRIRHEVLNAADEEVALHPFLLEGRGHEPRATLNPRLAGILRGQDLPRLRIDGFGPNNFYPARILAQAQNPLKRHLGWSPIEFNGSNAEPSVYRVALPDPSK